MKYVETKEFDQLKTILKTNRFFPVILSGPSGVGKTFAVEELAKELGRECVRIQMTYDTTIEKMIGNISLSEGSTYFRYGPVIDAMKKGAILLIDEIDLASPINVMFLQSILEGNGYHIEGNNERVLPAEGFTIVATANTKGQGDLKGGFVGTQILNEAFLDRFKLMLDFGYPDEKTEMDIMKAHYETLKTDIEFDESICSKLIGWANEIRESYLNQASEKTISPRRLLTISEIYHTMFSDLRTAVEMGLSRYDDDEKASFLEILSAKYENFFGDEETNPDSDDPTDLESRLDKIAEEYNKTWK